jgi:hypothetical protein
MESLRKFMLGGAMVTGALISPFVKGNSELLPPHHNEQGNSGSNRISIEANPYAPTMEAFKKVHNLGNDLRPLRIELNQVELNREESVAKDK